MNRLIFACCCLLVLSACNQPYEAPRYEYKTKKPNIAPYTGWKKDKDTAMNEIVSKRESDAKVSCRHIGVGWSLHEIKNQGEIECEETPNGHRCRNKNIGNYSA